MQRVGTIWPWQIGKAGKCECGTTKKLTDAATMMTDMKPKPDRGVRVQRLVRHAEGEQEHSLCGMAFDAFSSGDADEEIIFAKPGETVTCQECRDHIAFVRRCYRRYRYVPSA